ncbi:GTPase [Nevskia sp.]|uniref:GTPase n=1 Tax=Nevskia sp. TaxID=1929292 RepID=UPI0025ECA098|nr:GTPase [Nevskia sp.]
MNWFDQQAKPFLSAHAPEKLPSLQSDYERLQRLIARPDHITVCFLGNSGVGKSTLLNALAADEAQVLPAGGIGPLTAQATEVLFDAPELASADEGDAPSDNLEGLIKQARNIVCGKQFAEQPLEYLVDALRFACSMEPKWDARLDDADMQRVIRIRRILAAGKSGQVHERKSQARTFAT